MAATQAPAATIEFQPRRFLPAADGGGGTGTAIMQFADPAPAVAFAVAMSPETLTAPTQADLALLLIPAEAPNKTDWERRAREWLEASPGPAPVRILLDEDDRDWILFRPGQAVISAHARDLGSLLAAVVDFAYHEFQLRELETQIATDWPMVEKHLPLIHDVNAETKKALGDLGPATKQAMLRRMRYARLEPHLVSVPDTFRNSSRQAARRLRARTNIEARLEAADAQIEVYEDVYDMANQRVGEHTHFIKEYRMELLILIVLSAELIVILVDFYMNHFRPVVE